MDIVAAATSTQTEPGWGKLIALLAAMIGTWVAFQVWDRVQRVRSGAEANPFTRSAPGAIEGEEPQVDTPSEGSSESKGRGWGKWVGKG